MFHKLSAALAFIGLIIIVANIILALPTFRGFQEEGYNFLQHFISELGNPYKNPNYQLLNYGLMIIGILFMPMIVAFGKETKSRVGYMVIILGILGMIALAMVGYIPEHKLRNHTIAAFSCFTLTAMTTGLVAGLSIWKHQIPKWLFIPSIIPTALFIIFLFYPKIELHNITSDPHGYIRPEVVGLAVLEWSFFITTSFWIACTSFFLWRVKNIA